MDEMLTEIAQTTRATSAYTGVEKIAANVMAALERVDRAGFVPHEAQRLAYANHPLGIGHGQTISQPYIVALMTHLLDPEPGDRILEIGTGSGYQAAVLAELAAAVYTIEIVPELAATAAERLDALGYDSIEVRGGDGWYGWPEEAPFDGIILTAVAPDVPPRLLSQLKDGGTMVLPVGDEYGDQTLIAIDKSASGEVSRRAVLPVRFVPLTGAGILTLRETKE